MNLKHTQLETNTTTGPTRFPDLCRGKQKKAMEDLAELKTELLNSHRCSLESSIYQEQQPKIKVPLPSLNSSNSGVEKVCG